MPIRRLVKKEYLLRKRFRGKKRSRWDFFFLLPLMHWIQHNRLTKHRHLHQLKASLFQYFLESNDNKNSSFLGPKKRKLPHCAARWSAVWPKRFFMLTKPHRVFFSVSANIPKRDNTTFGCACMVAKWSRVFPEGIWTWEKRRDCWEKSSRWRISTCPHLQLHISALFPSSSRSESSFKREGETIIFTQHLVTASFMSVPAESFSSFSRLLSIPFLAAEWSAVAPKESLAFTFAPTRETKTSKNSLPYQEIVFFF